LCTPVPKCKVFLCSPVTKCKVFCFVLTPKSNFSSLETGPCLHKNAPTSSKFH
jgi:hypothetical protein